MTRHTPQTLEVTCPYCKRVFKNLTPFQAELVGKEGCYACYVWTRLGKGVQDEEV